MSDDLDDILNAPEDPDDGKTRGTHLTPEAQAELDSWKDAFSSEWAIASTGTSKEEKREEVDKEIDKLVPDALLALKHDIKFSRIPNVRQKAYMFVIQTRLDSITKGENDPLTRFLKDMEKAGAHADATDEAPDTESRHSSEAT